MGLLEQVVGGLVGGAGGSPIQSVLMGLLGRNDGQNAGAASQASPLAGLAGPGGGLGGLVSAFEQAGLGHVVQSWIGSGPNQPVSPEQLRSVFGEGQTRTMAQNANMDEGDFLSQLSQHLPRAVDGMTQGGDEGTVSV